MPAAPCDCGVRGAARRQPARCEGLWGGWAARREQRCSAGGGVRRRGSRRRTRCRRRPHRPARAHPPAARPHAPHLLPRPSADAADSGRPRAPHAPCHRALPPVRCARGRGGGGQRAAIAPQRRGAASRGCWVQARTSSAKALPSPQRGQTVVRADQKPPPRAAAAPQPLMRPLTAPAPSLPRAPAAPPALPCRRGGEDGRLLRRPGGAGGHRRGGVRGPQQGGAPRPDTAKPPLHPGGCCASSCHPPTCERHVCDACDPPPRPATLPPAGHQRE